jgi:hypothetical protein
VYARVSTDAQQKEGTIESQVLELKRQIAAAGDLLVKEYVDDGYSGTLLDRPALEELRRDGRTPLFDAVYFLDTDRIARDVAYQTIILGELIKHGKRIIIKGKELLTDCGEGAQVAGGGLRPLRPELLAQFGKAFRSRFLRNPSRHLEPLGLPHCNRRGSLVSCDVIARTRGEPQPMAMP